MNTYNFNTYKDTSEEKKGYGKLKEGKNKIRILDFITGEIEWKDKKPFRYKPGEVPMFADAKFFISTYVWDYEAKDLLIYEFTQAGILKTMKTLFEEWDGKINGFDLIIEKTTKGKYINKEGKECDSVSYSATACAPKPVSPEILRRWEEVPANLEALFAGGNPWKDLKAKHEVFDENDWMEVKEDPFQKLSEACELNNMDTRRLNEFVIELGAKKGISYEKALDYAIQGSNLPTIQKMYAQFLNQKAA